jgi:hypothetical protein
MPPLGFVAAVISPFWDAVADVGYEEDQSRNNNPWDILYLNGERVPGIATVKVIPKIRIELLKASGRDGGPTIERGHEAARLDITIKIWTPAQWNLLNVQLAALWRSPGHQFRSRATTDGSGKVVQAAAGAIRIAHPACSCFTRIASILFESVESPEPAPEQGARLVKIKAVQYIPKSEKDVTLVRKGTRAPLAPELDGKAKNGVAPKPVSKTDLAAKPQPEPSPGST